MDEYNAFARNGRENFEMDSDNGSEILDGNNVLFKVSSDRIRVLKETCQAIPQRINTAICDINKMSGDGGMISTSEDENLTAKDKFGTKQRRTRNTFRDKLIDRISFCFIFVHWLAGTLVFFHSGFKLKRS